MKKLFTSFLIICLIAIYINIIVSPITTVASEDTDDRNWPMYSLQQINEGVLGNDVVFNSINIVDSDYTWHKETYGEDIPTGTITNESNFVGARENTGINAGANNVWNGDRIKVEEGKSYIVRLYVHNNNPNGEQAIAENTRVSFNIPNASSSLVEVGGFIYSDNATVNGLPYYDNVLFESDGTPFHLEYIDGSALLENLADYNTRPAENGKTDIIGFKLSDDIIKAASVKGVKIGYKLGSDGQPNGQVPGCYQYDSYITIEVKAVFDYEYTIETLVRIQGENEWQKTVEAKVGDRVEFQIQYKNTSQLNQSNVAIRDVLPNNLKFVPGSIYFRHADENGNAVTEHVLGDSLVNDGLLIGTYTPGSNAYLIFTAEVVNNSLGCGSNTLVNWAQVGVGEKVIQDYAQVIVYNNQVFQIIILSICVLLAVCFLVGIILACRIRYLKYLASKIDKDKS